MLSTIWRPLFIAAATVLSTNATHAWDETLLINTESFAVIDDLSGDDIALRFGETVNQTLTYDIVANQFWFSDDLYVAGSLATANGITVNSDATGDALLIFGNDLQNQTIRLPAGGNAFQFSTGAVLTGRLTAAAATITTLSDCPSLQTDATGAIQCASLGGGPLPIAISVRTDSSSIASANPYNAFQQASYAAPAFSTAVETNATFDPVIGGITVQQSGPVLVLATISTIVNADSTVAYTILQNGTPIHQFDLQTDSGTDPPERTVQIVAQATAGDVFTVQVDSLTGTRTAAVQAGSTLSIISVASTGNGGALAPFLEATRKRIQPGENATLRINGGNFDPETTVSIPGWEGTIVDVRHLSDRQMEIDVTAGPTEATYDLILANGSKTSQAFQADNGSGAIVVAASTWVDLRSGGDSFTHGTGAGNDVRYRGGMSLARDAGGTYFTGSSPWNSWVKFESLGWTRGSNRTLEWIMTNPTSAMMIGIGSDATNETSASQWAEAEVQAYFTNSNQLWGLYGNNGTPGSFGSQSNPIGIPNGAIKIKFEQDGDFGDLITLYQLPTLDPVDWDDESTVLGSITIGGTLNPNEVNIMPFIIPNSGGSQRFVAVRVE